MLVTTHGITSELNSTTLQSTMVPYNTLSANPIPCTATGLQGNSFLYPDHSWLLNFYPMVNQLDRSNDSPLWCIYDLPSKFKLWLTYLNWNVRGSNTYMSHEVIFFFISPISTGSSGRTLSPSLSREDKGLGPSLSNLGQNTCRYWCRWCRSNPSSENECSEILCVARDRARNHDNKCSNVIRWMKLNVEQSNNCSSSSTFSWPSVGTWLPLQCDCDYCIRFVATKYIICYVCSVGGICVENTKRNKKSPSHQKGGMRTKGNTPSSRQK